ncbi:MAG: hypothetical protein HYT62_02435 [Candidatus Yanofskybacteria bacterium]|nr:hypothetical protein [Candidatus Yanofskybacteria bacterium]
MVTIFLEYFYWHYTVAPFEILQIMRNYLKANWHRFLIVQHFKTLFAPWHRQNPSDFGSKNKTFSDRILDKIADFYIRIIAALIRLLIIFAGLIWEFVLLIFFLLLFAAWLAWPAIAIFLIIKGVNIVSQVGV